MMPTLRAEFRKLFSVRWTYYLIVIILLIIFLYAGFITGFRANHANLVDPGYLTSQITGAIGAVTILGALAGLILFGYEYRYNLIIYTLTGSNSRTKVFLAKAFVVTVFALITTIIFGAISPLVTLVGIHLHGHHLVSQSITYGAIWWRCLLFGWAYSMLAFIIAALLRNQIGSIVVYFLVPSTVEGLLTLLLKNNAKYLPFTAVQAILSPGQVTGGSNPHTEAIIGLIYVVVGWLIAWILFVRRNAN